MSRNDRQITSRVVDIKRLTSRSSNMKCTRGEPRSTHVGLSVSHLCQWYHHHLYRPTCRLHRLHQKSSRPTGIFVFEHRPIFTTSGSICFTLFSVALRSNVCHTVKNIWPKITILCNLKYDVSSTYSQSKLCDGSQMANFWRFFASFSASRMQHFSDLHPNYGRPMELGAGRYILACGFFLLSFFVLSSFFFLFLD